LCVVCANGLLARPARLPWLCAPADSAEIHVSHAGENCGTVQACLGFEAPFPESPRAPDDLALAPGGRGLGIGVENHVFGVSSFFGLAKRAEGGAHAWLRLPREREKAVGGQKRQFIK